MNILVDKKGSEIFAETFGNKKDPAILLIMGAGGPGMRWGDDFCNKLAKAGRFVIRYDHRDSGQSTAYPPGKPGYTMKELTEDPLAVLEKLGIQSAHIVGISLGGIIAQRLAIFHPDRVASLTLIATTPSAPGHTDEDLPQMSATFLNHVRQSTPPDWQDKRATVDFIVEREQICAGESPYFDEKALKKVWSEIYDHTKNFASCMQNHFTAATCEPWRPLLKKIDVPTLVIHGTDDPVMPYGHGVALSKEIPHAQLLTIEGMGHEVVPEGTWPVVVPAIIKHTS